MRKTRKLSLEQVHGLKEDLEDASLSMSEIALKYGVSTANVYHYNRQCGARRVRQSAVKRGYLGISEADAGQINKAMTNLSQEIGAARTDIVRYLIIRHAIDGSHLRDFVRSVCSSWDKRDQDMEAHAKDGEPDAPRSEKPNPPPHAHNRAASLPKKPAFRLPPCAI